MPHPGWIAALVFLFDLVVRIGLSIRVIMRRLPVGTSLAWLGVILLFPFAGAIIYMYLGEYRLGRRRKRRIAALDHRWQRRMAETAAWGAEQPAPVHADHVRLTRLAHSQFLAPLLPGNRLQLLPGADEAFAALVADIDRAENSCDLEFYIWQPGGRVDDVSAALVRAVARGVRCRLLVDALGSAHFQKSGAMASLRQAGVQVQAALPTGLVNAPFVRPDLRLHRKIVIIDRRIGYTGSLNMADPRTFKQEAGVGQWIDAMARVEGPTALLLAASFLVAWSVESGSEIEAEEWDAPLAMAAGAGEASVQVLPSGPIGRVTAIEEIVLSAIYAAHRELILTTPYFVPSEAMQTALLSAAGSGVDVKLIVPARIDSRLVRLATPTYLRELAAAGVKVFLFDGGLLHTKSIAVDDDFALFGSLNLDPRSLRLNFEISLAIYDASFTGALKSLQSQYLADSQRFDAARDESGPVLRLCENTARLLSPVL